MKHVAVIDYGMGNLHSVAKALEHVGDGLFAGISATTSSYMLRKATHDTPEQCGFQKIVPARLKVGSTMDGTVFWNRKAAPHAEESNTSGNSYTYGPDSQRPPEANAV